MWAQRDDGLHEDRVRALLLTDVPLKQRLQFVLWWGEAGALPEVKDVTGRGFRFYETRDNTMGSRFEDCAQWTDVGSLISVALKEMYKGQSSKPKPD